MGDSEKLRLMRFVYLRVGHHEKRANHRAIVSGDRAKRATHRAKRLKHQAMRARDRTKRAGYRAKRAIFHAFCSKHREKNSTSRAFVLRWCCLELDQGMRSIRAHQSPVFPFGVAKNVARLDQSGHQDQNLSLCAARHDRLQGRQCRLRNQRVAVSPRRAP